MSEIDLTLALQLQAQFEEELRVSLLKQQEEKNKQKNEGTSLFLDFQGTKKIKNPLGEPQQEKLSLSLIDPSWELIDPNPDIHTLFLVFNDQFFWGRLAGVEVRWSPRMTLCAGVCCYEGRGGLCSVRLSLPLLKLRPRKDLIETLLCGSVNIQNYSATFKQKCITSNSHWQAAGPSSVEPQITMSVTPVTLQLSSHCSPLYYKFCKS